MQHQEINTATPSATGKPDFDDIVIKIGCEGISNSFEGTVEQLAGMEYQMPNIPVGAYVLIESSGKLTHSGIATETSGPGKLSGFSAQLMPLSQPCSYSKRKPDHIGKIPLLAMPYVVEVTSDGNSYKGSATKLSKADGDHLRWQIGPFVPSEILEVFWSESEIAAIEAKYSAQERYIDNANALFQTL